MQFIFNIGENFIHLLIFLVEKKSPGASLTSNTTTTTFLLNSG